MSETLVPSVPPVSPFEAYTIIIVLPFLMRLIFVAPRRGPLDPGEELVQEKQYSPPRHKPRHARPKQLLQQSSADLTP